jgi:hypothetical protein
MTVKELLIHEIDTMSDLEIVNALDLIRSLRSQAKAQESKPPHRKGSGKSVLRHVGKWVGDDLPECLEMVYASRGAAKF